MTKEERFEKVVEFEKTPLEQYRFNYFLFMIILLVLGFIALIISENVGIILLLLALSMFLKVLTDSYILNRKVYWRRIK